MYILTDEGEEYLKIGFPETNLLKLLNNGPMTIDDAKKKIKNFNIALQWAKKNDWIEIREGKLFKKNETA